MQLKATDALDISNESEATKEMYGLDDERTRSYGMRLLRARRLVERGVRFVRVFIEHQIWDNHLNLDRELGYACAKTDKPVAALIKDLAATTGRDHGPAGFSMWMVGGGVKGGHVHGATEEIGHKAVEDRVSVHDFHATMLHQLGLDAQALTYNPHGLEERLIGQYPARVVEAILV